ncbi:hypothetical protein M406DRAFT_336913 [Cryphonectria parasitica EP155]|uniref:non-specific serine/threonine protein kinase n=1 Tax=Cryphonectria parasitica (strain ATCC 38755 / EP155) TaxID=660469 RepID=A0A9P4Y8S9_CRYP1|nr:uncharacterized protein M406DRAFT_336913 [Cryphonectria parasitica EP155]KAF3768447.1 hypothetical protein M406DRAFT_336913 [Cryphonectria parasitica EP155]
MQGQVCEARSIPFATLRPGNAPTPCLINKEDGIAYLLSLPPLPNGSRVGAGPSPSLPKTQTCCSKVDILLCPPGSSHSSKHARKSIKSIHAILLFHPESESLLLRNVCSLPIIYESGDVNGDDLTLRGGGPDSSCVLLRQSNHLHFGEYNFILEFNLQSQDYNTFTAERNRLCQIRPATRLGPVPNEQHFTLWDVRVHGEISNRLPESVHYGIQLHSGRPVAVKRIVYKVGRETGRRARAELQVASTSCGTSDGVLGMITSWCEHGESPPCWIEKEMDWLWRKLGDSTRLGYLHQTLSGLNKIHSRGFIHGRIRPKSLMIDIGSPPEVWTSSKETCYSSKADVWALAASWLRAFLIPPADLWRKGAAYSVYTSLYIACYLSMLAWEPDNRPSAEEALQHTAWEPLRRREQQRDDCRRRQREEEVMRGPADGAKKVRLLSPEKE